MVEYALFFSVFDDGAATVSVCNTTVMIIRLIDHGIGWLFFGLITNFFVLWMKSVSTKRVYFGIQCSLYASIIYWNLQGKQLE